MRRPPILAKAPTPAPKRSVVVNWPGWGETLAVIAESGRPTAPVPGSRALPDDVPEPLAVALSPREHATSQGMVAADLAGNGVEPLDRHRPE